MREKLLYKQSMRVGFILSNECNVTVAKEQYVEKYKDNHLYDCGLVVNPGFSFLGATPDGKLCSNGTIEIIEIKCPYAVRDLYIEEAVVTAKWSQRRYCGTIVTEKYY
ncbi:Hypothetical predicted protein [Mytilus galloprovincialis]|uniref:YqaJ viral recombinase domain-containing protein n=1 Tax=Mytilus galloprovincialis TaxID=29158 RepID=A0A8B6GP86_MYTGA|nr:Hypothetical predicted protein [Mytilus galloprovincialis]